MSKANPENRCQYSSPSGRPCRMSRSNTHPSLCAHHARQEERQPNDDPEALATDLLGPVKEFNTSASVNYVLGNLLRFVVTQRIAPRNAAVTAYICQLLLQSMPEVKHEIFQLQHGAGMQQLAEQVIENLRNGVPPIHRAKSRQVPPPAPLGQQPITLSVVEEQVGSVRPASNSARS